MLTSLAIMVAAASAIAARCASTVTESAMPRDCERPRQPEVAMPRTGSPLAISMVASMRGSDRSPTTPARIDCPSARWIAMSPPLLTIARRSGAASTISSSTCSATAPATAAIGVMNTSR